MLVEVNEVVVIAVNIAEIFGKEDVEIIPRPLTDYLYPYISPDFAQLVSTEA